MKFKGTQVNYSRKQGKQCMNKMRKVINKYKPYKGTKQKSWSRRHNDRMEKFSRDLQQLTLSHRKKKSSNSWTDYLKLTKEEQKEKK